MKPISSLKVSISGIRGVVGDSLKPSLICRFARGFATYLGPGAIVLGRDTRTSGEMVKHAVLAGLLSCGSRVIDVDISPVPTIQRAVRKLRARGGIAITASHNPAEWNALKFIKADGCFLNSYEAQELLSIYHQEQFNDVLTSQLQPVERYPQAVDEHCEHILQQLQPHLEPPLKVVIDCCNGAGAVMTPLLLERLGCEVVPLNCAPNGHFPRPPEPLPANLGELCRKVSECGADVGFAQDADADRLAIVSEEGKAIGEEYTLALCVYSRLSRQPGPVAVNLSTSRMIDDIAEQFGCKVHRSRIGEVNVTEMLMDRQAVIGGEGNGGVIDPLVNLARDSFVAMTMIVDLMRRRQMKVSQLTGLFPAYQMVKQSAHIHPHRIPLLLESLARRYRHETLNRLDGLKIERPDGWIHLRPSNTEPIMRFLIEAVDRETLARFAAEIQSLLDHESETDT